MALALLPQLLAHDPRVAPVIDDCDLRTGEVRQGTAHGEADVIAFHPIPARRKVFVRYLGEDEAGWDTRLRVDYLSQADQARPVSSAWPPST